MRKGAIGAGAGAILRPPIADGAGVGLMVKIDVPAIFGKGWFARERCWRAGWVIRRAIRELWRFWRVDLFFGGR